ncbi:hypothetical protein [Roseovarius sp.]|uniref:hypothetical protein n=1 Tax=Roseovarius sp. TaxID=1486281 RepID=UPI00261EBE98|nr:hypothetical protein [Roseovarius sp.]MDM8167925.1 hypothetical protein [Roseovarius sp.]
MRRIEPAHPCRVATFRDPVSPEVCEADDPSPFIPVEEEPAEGPMDRLFEAFANQE